ncbi:MAG TPA: hypothetical protein VJP07_05450 [Dehalococcoidia bacterium]|nr:hypothetical protein [Dehalococcoidia bacterium]
MKTAKQEILELIAQIPDDASYETILAEMQFKLDVLRGYQQFLEGRTSPHEDVIARIRDLLAA